MGSNTSAQYFPTLTHAYYALGRALLRGDPQAKRPPLPLELVLQIFDGIGHKRHNPSLNVNSPQICNIDSDILPTKMLFFHSEAVTRDFLNRVVQMRLDTISKDQGWFGNPYTGRWSWFEIGILRPYSDGTPQNDPNIVELNFKASATRSYVPVRRSDGTGRAFRWISHKNRIATLFFQAHNGQLFGPEHEIWDSLTEGDVICVYACAANYLQNNAKSGRLIFWERFDPTNLPHAYRWDWWQTWVWLTVATVLHHSTSHFWDFQHGGVST
jgi:hypothetical protein